MYKLTDGQLIELYHKFSGDRHSVQWFGDAKEHVEEFKEWLKEELVKEVYYTSYEMKGLPLLRQAYTDTYKEVFKDKVEYYDIVQLQNTEHPEYRYYKKVRQISEASDCMKHWDMLSNKGYAVCTRCKEKSSYKHPQPSIREIIAECSYTGDK